MTPEGYIQLGVLFIAIASAAYSFFTTRSRASKQDNKEVRQQVVQSAKDQHEAMVKRTTELHARIDDVISDMNGLGNRVSVVEETIKHLPTDQVIKNMSQDISVVSGEMKEMLGEFRAVRHQVSSIDDFLRKQGTHQS